MTQERFFSRSHRNRQNGGQTIIVALIVLGILLILGLLFLSIINRSVSDSSRMQTRGRANELAESGIRFAHNQLVNSNDGADWRGTPTLPIAEVGNPNFSRDPDAGYLRPASFLTLSTGAVDLGGPDGLGPYVRVPSDNGRSLIRVRYAPSDANMFSSSPVGALRDPGAVRNYLVIESIGRTGRVDTNDPTTLLSADAVQFTSFASSAALEAALAAFNRAPANVNAKILTAFVSIGITDAARSISNINKVSRPAEIGIPENLGSLYFTDNGTTRQRVDVGSQLALQLGTDSIENVVGPSKVYGIGGLGSLHSNADITWYGKVNVFANALLGDQLTISGQSTGADGSVLSINRRDFQRTTQSWLPNEVFALAAGAGLESRSSQFNTAKGIFKDGISRTDQAGYPRGVGYKNFPRFTAVDAQTGDNRYVRLTKNSGSDVAQENAGEFGHGHGVFLNNAGDRQIPRSEAGRAGNPGTESLVFDWLNPNHPDSKYWLGSFYMPPGATIEFRADGFIITRDGRAPASEQFWKSTSGSDSGLRTIRYRLGRGTDRSLRIVNSLTPGIGAIDGNLSEVDYSRGPTFNGVIYAAGNVRVRGVIPTDVQLTLATDSTAYIEGSLVKGTVGTQWTATYNPSLGDPEASTPAGIRIGRPSRSAIGIMARDYIALNTTMFFGPAATQKVESVRDLQALKIAQDGALALQSEFIQGPTATADQYDPSAWRPYALQYRDAVSNDNLNVRLMLSHAMEDGAADRSFIGLSINPGQFDNPAITSTYQFPNVPENAAFPAYEPANPAFIPQWGLGIENYQRAPKFESIGFPIVSALTATYTDPIITANSGEGNFRLNGSGTNYFQIAPSQLNGQPTNDYLLARAAVSPHDIRIEAMLYAEQGAFFVIPGPWFNENANDRRDTYIDRLIQLRTAGETPTQAKLIADDERLTNFGSRPETPFYGEPIDVRVSIVGAVTENMPPSMGEQSAWLRKWGWIPGKLGSTISNIPSVHVPNGQDLATVPVVPNLIFSYDPVLGSGRSNAFANLNDPSRLLRTDRYGRTLPPLPRLPVSPTLAYFGELN